MLDVRKMLYSYKKLEVGLANIERSLQNLAVVKEFPSGVASYSDMPKGSGTDSTTEKFALKNIELMDEGDRKREQLQRDREAYDEALQLIRSALSTLSVEESEVIRLRYFQGYQMQKVSIMMGIANSTCRYYQAKALLSLEQCLNGGRLDLKLKWFEKKEKAPAG